MLNWVWMNSKWLADFVQKKKKQAINVWSTNCVRYRASRVLFLVGNPDSLGLLELQAGLLVSSVIHMSWFFHLFHTNSDASERQRCEKVNSLNEVVHINSVWQWTYCTVARRSFWSLKSFHCCILPPTCGKPDIYLWYQPFSHSTVNMPVCCRLVKWL